VFVERGVSSAIARNRMFHSALDALDVMAKMNATGISLHMIYLVCNDVSKVVFTIVSAVARPSAAAQSRPAPASTRQLSCAPPPAAADVLLVIEVSDTSLRYEREVKLPLYARHGIPEAWVVDLAARVVEVHRTPDGSAYTEVTTRGRGEVLEPLPGIRIPVDELLGAP
jgi:hypothetical protein